MTLYEELYDSGCIIRNHESDLYVECTRIALEILAKYPLQESISTRFRSLSTDQRMIEIPFAYDPFWKN